MGDDGFSAMNSLRKTSQHAKMPPEDLQTIVELYQKRPHLWDYFRDIVHVVDLITSKPQADEQLLSGLRKIDHHFEFQNPHHEQVIHFAVFCGLAERIVAFSRQILQEMGRSYVTEFPDVIDNSVNVETACLYYIRCQLLNCTVTSSEFSQRVIQTGFLQDLVEDLRHIQHLTLEALERGKVFLLSLGTIHNCCLHPETAAAVKQLDIVPHVTPFLTKRGHNHLIQSIAAGVIAHVADDDQLDLLVLDAELLQYYLQHVQQSLSSHQGHHSNWSTKEILFDLHLLARNDFNKRLMVAQGTLRSLHSILEPSKKRAEEEKRLAVDLISRLIEDRTNLQICQNFQELVGVLKGLPQSGAKETVEKVRGILLKLGRRNKKDLANRVPAFPHLAQLLADQFNVLSILDMGLVEFVLDELKVLTEELSKAAAHGNEVFRKQVLLALSELAADDVYRREILARGGLDMVKTVLQRGSSEEQTEAARAVLGLAMAPENRPVIQLKSDLTTLLDDLKQRADNRDLAQLAENILLELHQ